jgi:hypothetical protein
METLKNHQAKKLNFGFGIAFIFGAREQTQSFTFAERTLYTLPLSYTPSSKN